MDHSREGHIQHAIVISSRVHVHIHCIRYTHVTPWQLQAISMLRGGGGASHDIMFEHTILTLTSGFCTRVGETYKAEEIP